MDGACAWQYALFVQLPMLWPAILLTIIFSINGTLQLFNEPYLMRSIAPSVINTHYTPNIYAYFLSAANQQYNYAAAVSFVLGLTHCGDCRLLHAGDPSRNRERADDKRGRVPQWRGRDRSSRRRGGRSG